MKKRKEITKDKVIRTRVTGERKKQIERFCKENKITISVLIEMGIDCIIKK